MKGIGAAGRGGRRAALAAPAPIPPAAPPPPLGTLRGSDAQPALPRDTASLCALRPRRRSSAPDLGAARLPPGAAPRRPRAPGLRWAARSPPPTAGFPTWKQQMQPLLAARAGLWGCRLPGLALGKCRGAGASAALAAPGE